MHGSVNLKAREFAIFASMFVSAYFSNIRCILVTSLLNAFLISISKRNYVRQGVWFTRIDEQLTCDQESGNRHDNVAMAIAESCKKFNEQNFDELLTICQIQIFHCLIYTIQYLP